MLSIYTEIYKWNETINVKLIMLAYIEDVLLPTLSYKYSLLITLNGV